MVGPRAHGPKGRLQLGRLAIRVRFPVGPLETEGIRIGLGSCVLSSRPGNGVWGSIPRPSARSTQQIQPGVRGVAVAARLAVNQEARVRLPSNALLPSRSNPRVCSWESKQPPNLPHEVRLLALVLNRPALERAARWHCPRGAPDSHPTRRRSWTRFDSWRGRFLFNGSELSAKKGRAARFDGANLPRPAVS